MKICGTLQCKSLLSKAGPKAEWCINMTADKSISAQPFSHSFSSVMCWHMTGMAMSEHLGLKPDKLFPL